MQYAYAALYIFIYVNFVFEVPYIQTYTTIIFFFQLCTMT